MALMYPHLTRLTVQTLMMTAHCRSVVTALPPVFSMSDPVAGYYCPVPQYVLHPAPYLVMPRRRQIPQTILLPRPAMNFATGFGLDSALNFGVNSVLGFEPNFGPDFAAMCPQRLVSAADSAQKTEVAAVFLRVMRVTLPSVAAHLVTIPVILPVSAYPAAHLRLQASVTTHQATTPPPEVVRLETMVAVARFLGLSALLACLAATLVNQNQT